MHAFVGADRYRMPEGRQHVVVAVGQRLLDQRHAGGGASGEVVGEVLLGPGFVGVDDQLGVGRGAAHRGDPLRVAGAAELHLEQRAVGGLGAAAAIASGVASEIV